MDKLIQWFKNLQKHKADTGVDMGNRNIKVIKLSENSGKLVLDDLFMLDLSESNDQYPENTNAHQKLKAAIEVNGLQGAKISAAVGGSHVNVIDLRLPEMPKEELELVIQKNLEDVVGASLSNVTYDYQVIKNTSQTENILVRVYYSELDYVIEKVEMLKSANLKPVSFEVSHLAILEMLKLNNYIKNENAYIVVDFGETVTNSALIYKNQVISSFSTPVAFGSINKEMREQMDCDYITAEQAKPYLNKEVKIENKSVEEIVDQTYLKILEGTQEAIDYYLHQDIEAKVSEIFITGGGAVYGTAKETLEEHYEIPVTHVNPFRNIETLRPDADPELAVKIQQLAPFMATAVGLAVAGGDK